MLKQYFEVDNDGNIINTHLLDNEFDIIPINYKKGWGDRKFYQPRWDFEIEDWVESLTEEEIRQITDRPQPPTLEERLQEEMEQLREEKRMTDLALLELVELILGGDEGGE